MPLVKGSSRAAIAKNIRQLIKDFKKSGKIGNIKPRSLAHARRIAAAIAYRLARESRKKGKKGYWRRHLAKRRS